MAYANSVGIMPGAAAEKLPFVHSNFKPSSKLAKCFDGFKKYTRQYNSSSRSEYRNQKLPQIYYSGGDTRNLITWGSNVRSGKSEYPGFMGKKKFMKKKDNATNAHSSNSGTLVRNKSHSMKQYLSLPNLNNSHKSGGNFVQLENDGKHRLNSSMDSDDDRQMIYGKGYNLDSLIFFDDDNESQHQHPMVVGNSVNHNNTMKFKDKTESFHRCSPIGNHPLVRMDSFTTGVNEKLREARGKSGMKRDRRREPDHMRILGDVVTAERLHELLLPRKHEGQQLNFE